ncbi:MAG TPA: 23S rRNA (adenine(2503)-C(2))-methyltransferase RlmN [Polyangiaceae bacterium]|nr:23S rRNA (adenine(2503)-C(2))-methyltransferase RlmN [Polyangiaceae bacterium]
MRRLPLSLTPLEAGTVAPSASDAFGLLPADLVARGIASGAATFSALQRPWRWQAGVPDLSPRLLGALDACGRTLPLIERMERSEDGATKLLLRTGPDLIEAVHMPRSVTAGERVTLCISSQVGCAMGCDFCATASMGFVRHLSAGEIVAQVLAVLHTLGPRHPSELTLVFMGMGEPLHNLDNVARAIEVLTATEGLGIAPRRITVSTSGLVPQIARLGALAARPLLAISLNATLDEQRLALMPINRRYPLAEIQRALRAFPLRPRERITVEYVLLAGVNDSLEDAERLAAFCDGFSHGINLIPFNAHAHAGYRPPTSEQLERFTQVLIERGRGVVTVRRSRGRDVQGACGQLVQAYA